MEVLEVVGSMSCPVLVIPGNHDHGGVGGIWRREDLQRQMQDRATNLQLLLASEPVLVAGITVLPCPLLRQHESRNPLLWLEQLDWQTLDPSAPRVVLAHGRFRGLVTKIPSIGWSWIDCRRMKLIMWHSVIGMD